MAFWIMRAGRQAFDFRCDVAKFCAFSHVDDVADERGHMTMRDPLRRVGKTGQDSSQVSWRSQRQEQAPAASPSSSRSTCALAPN